jgi:carbon monoxide dehydrogenase subunit G
MTTIESKKVELARTTEEVSAYVQDLNNFEKLLPRDRVSDFESDGESCSFKINGMAKIGLKVASVESNLVKLESTDSPFSFTINVHLDSQNEGTSAYQIVNLELNPMMKMMVEKPLRNLFDHISDRLQSELS